MKNAEKKWDEVVTYTESESTKAENAAIGAAGGALLGGAAAAVVGGIGIVVAGTGVGLPAGAALIATAATIGGSVGGVAGAATGETSTHTVEKVITHIEPAYQAWQWGSVIALSVFLLLLAVINIRKKLKATKSMS